MVPARTLKFLLVSLACIAVPTACARGPAQPTQEEQAAQAQREAVEFANVQYLWRARRIIDLNRPDGWTSLVGLHWLDPGVHRVGSDTDNGIRLAMGPEHLGVFTVRGKGRGGRNVECLLSAAITLDGQARVYGIGCDTDGVDGAEDIAGALIDPSTLARAWAKGLPPKDALDNNDGHGFFQALGDSVITGPTRTNVNDFRALLIEAAAPTT